MGPVIRREPVFLPFRQFPLTGEGDHPRELLQDPRQFPLVVFHREELVLQGVAVLVVDDPAAHGNPVEVPQPPLVEEALAQVLRLRRPLAPHLGEAHGARGLHLQGVEPRLLHPGLGGDVEEGVAAALYPELWLQEGELPGHDERPQVPHDPLVGEGPGLHDAPPAGLGLRPGVPQELVPRGQQATLGQGGGMHVPEPLLPPVQLPFHRLPQ